MPPDNSPSPEQNQPVAPPQQIVQPQPAANAAPQQPVAPPEPTPTPVVPPPPPLPSVPVPTAPTTDSGRQSSKKIKLVFAAMLLFTIFCSTTAYFIGKHGQHVVYRIPTPPPVTLPPQAIVVKECVPGFGKQYVIPKDIPNGPIYDVYNSKVIAVEYNYKAVELFLNPDKLSKTVVPFSKNYQIDSFTTSIGELKAGSIEQAQNVPIHLVMYVVPKKEAQKITCNTKQS